MCGYTLCRNCEQTDETDEHKCYIQPKKPKACPENYIFFDYEAEQDTGVHNPNLIVAHHFRIERTQKRIFSTLFQYKRKPELCRAHSRYKVLWR